MKQKCFLDKKKSKLSFTDITDQKFEVTADTFSHNALPWSLGPSGTKSLLKSDVTSDGNSGLNQAEQGVEKTQKKPNN